MAVTVFGDSSAFYLAKHLPSFRNAETIQVIERGGILTKLSERVNEIPKKVQASRSKRALLNLENTSRF